MSKYILVNIYIDNMQIYCKFSVFKKTLFYIWNLKIMQCHINLIIKTTSSKNKIHCFPGGENNIDYPNQTTISVHIYSP